MAEVKKIATRESYGQALVELGAMDERVVAIDADLAGSTKTGVFGKAFPERHFNCGIAECNVMGTAAGMAAMGLIPFASSFAIRSCGYCAAPVITGMGSISCVFVTILPPFFR